DEIETLPLRYRVIVKLRYDTQMSFREIGRALSILEATAKTYFIPSEKAVAYLAEVGVCVLLRQGEAMKEPPVSPRKATPMSAYQNTTVLLDGTREAGSNEHVEAVMTVQDVAGSLHIDDATVRDGIQGGTAETITKPSRDHR